MNRLKLDRWLSIQSSMNTLSILRAAVVAVSALSSVLHAADDRIENVVQRHLEPVIEAGLIPGAVVGVYVDGVESYYSVGFLDFENGVKPCFGTLYEIGSISKVFTGVLFADAVRRGEVSKDTLVDDLLPGGVDAKDYKGTEVRLWHLTSHTSGWPTGPANLRSVDGEDPFADYTLKKLYKYISAASPMTVPGEEFQYSNLAVGLLGTLIAQNADSEYEELVTERIFEPLGIEDILISLDDEDLLRLAPATSGGRMTKHWSTMGPLDGAGVWVASVPAMLGFAVANIEGGDGDVFESLEMAREPLADNAWGGRVGFGWMLAGDKTTWWHNGMTGGYSSYMAVNPTLEIAVVVLSNGASGYTTPAGAKIFQELAGMDVEPVEIAKQGVDEDYAQRLVGEYKGTAFTIWITQKRGKVFARLDDQPVLALLPMDDEKRFRYEVVDAVLEFEIGDEGVGGGGGEATKVTLFQNGMEMPCDRVED